jgi:Family of unknown function (DUF6062)
MRKVKVTNVQSSWDYERLSEACHKAGCILCRLTGETTRRYLETWKDEMFTDVNVRTTLRSSRGFCHTHTWQLVQMGASLPLAQAYRDIITDEIEQLANDSGKHKQRWFHSKSDDTSSSTAPCPACQQRDQSLARFTSSLRQAISDPTFYTLFLSSYGLCLDHFHLACTLKPLTTPESWLPLLRTAQLTILQHLNDQLNELIRKHDYRYKNETLGPEMTAWQTAAALVAGEPIPPP